MAVEVRTDIKTSSWGCLFGHVGKPACLASAGDPWRGFGVPASGLLASQRNPMNTNDRALVLTFAALIIFLGAA